MTIGQSVSYRGAVTATLGLGSNVGDRLSNLRQAVDLLQRAPRIRVIRSSRVYETKPVGGPPQQDFLNAVVQIETAETPQALLTACRRVEDGMGRVRGERWGPRVIDVDVLTYGREALDEPGLVIPHPRMHERAFVMVPLLELDADPPLPGSRSARDIRFGSEELAGVRPFAPPLV
ncbi:MAG TPA: 2-amino-4-hydroxy-6-hydroxymethyldihydropteridine diphosphokinase [Actinomycetota bacterium]|nr:2-amino-4-hydroxy-6-hydroxymethyldihydropteridine diphosphokinase [Actinomycetota bacterium]